MTDPLLAVEDLRAGYGETEVLHGVSLSVAPGEVVAVVGRNGAGKTTTLRAITGAVTPTAGSVVYDGTEITGRSPDEVARLGVGYVPEDRRIFPGLTVRENLAVGGYAESRASHSRDVEWALSTFENLGERVDSRGVDLSGGEQQMLAVARALVAGADLLMLDEPTEGLAPMVVDQVVDLVNEVSDDGVTVLLVEQNVPVALSLADRVYVVDRGRVVFEGTSAELREREDVVDRHLAMGE